ncbi:MAG TPA: ABC transporter substrate-binding protein [Clostridiales bacterium]|jgi:putative aldouronate transport system substrate-binding protein|nr:ABC transporter substrate-binding protein [Clostridiales bacterium]
MKKLSKRLLALLLVAVMLMATGCGKGDDKPADKKDPGVEKEKDQPSSSGDEESGEVVKITVYRPCFNIAQVDEAQLKKVQAAINDYIRDKINVEVEIFDISSGEFPDKCNLALAGGEVDLFWTSNWVGTVNTDESVKNNAVYDLTELLPQYDIYTAIPEWTWGASAFDGKNYFIPVYKESAEGYSLMFRKDLVDKYGWDLSTVKFLPDIEPMLADCKAEGLKYPYLSQKTPMFYRYYLDKFDFFSGDAYLAVDKDKDEVVNPILSPEFKEFATLMAQWAEKGYLHEDDLTKSTTDTTIQTDDWGISWWTNVPNNEEADSRYNRAVEMAKVTESWVMSNTTLGSAYAISVKATEAEARAALKFLSLLYTDQTLADLYTFGIEGEDYERTPEGTVTKLVEVNKYNHSAWESTSVTVLSLETGEPADKVDLYKAFNDSAQSSKAAGFRFNRINVDAIMTACDQVFEEYGFALEHGGHAVADIDAAIESYVQALNDAGYQELLAEAQSQYEAWKTTR